MPSSLIIVALVVAWLLVLVPIVARRRQEVVKTADSTLAARVVRSGGVSASVGEEFAMAESGDPDTGRQPDEAGLAVRADQIDDLDRELDEELDLELELDEELDEQLDVPVGVGYPRFDPGVYRADFATGGVDQPDEGEYDDELGEFADEADYADELADEPAPVGAAFARADQPEDEADYADDAEYEDEAEYEDAAEYQGEYADDDYADEEYEDDYAEDYADEPPGSRPYRPGRGGFDPEAAAATARAKYAFRQRIVVLLLVLALGTALVAGFVLPVVWWAHVLIDLFLVSYLTYLRRQVRIEQEIRDRRTARMGGTRRVHAAPAAAATRRAESAGPASAGVASYRSTSPAFRPHPGTVVVEADDEDPMFVDLDEPDVLPYRRAVGE